MIHCEADLTGLSATESGDAIEPVDVSWLELVRPRSVGGGGEVGLWVLDQLGLPDRLAELGLNGSLRVAGLLAGRLAHPASERATDRWLREQSELGELLEVGFQIRGAMQLYRASDALMAHREVIEKHLFDQATGLFDRQPTVTLFDLTNTFFEGQAHDQPKVQRRHSKDKRSDCRLLTLGLGLDASGFMRRSKVFSGGVAEASTLGEMLTALNAPEGALVVMDRDVATEDGITWLRQQGYRYLVVSRQHRRHFDTEAAVCLETASKQGVYLHRVVSEDDREVRLYCSSEKRAHKERGMVECFAQRFEQALTALSEGLATHWAAEGKKSRHRPTLPDPGHRRPQWPQSRRRDLDSASPPGFRGD